MIVSRCTAAHPPATAGGTDPVQIRLLTFTKPRSENDAWDALLKARRSLLDRVSTTRGSGWVRSRAATDEVVLTRSKLNVYF